MTSVPSMPVLTAGELIVVGSEGVALAVDQDDGVRLVGPQLDRLVGQRRLLVVDQRQMGLVARHAVGVVGGLRRVVEVLHQLRVDDEVAQALDRVVHADGEDLGSGPALFVDAAMPPPAYMTPLLTVVRQRDEGRPLGGNRGDVAACRVERQQAGLGGAQVGHADEHRRLALAVACTGPGLVGDALPPTPLPSGAACWARPSCLTIDAVQAAAVVAEPQHAIGEAEAAGDQT